MRHFLRPNASIWVETRHGSLTHLTLSLSPSRSDHPNHMHRNIPYAALVRAARLCSHVEDFNSERIRINMSLLLNDYPPDFMTKHFQRFFQLNNSMSVLEQLDAEVYQQLHEKFLYQPTRREKKTSTNDARSSKITQRFTNKNMEQ
jgi:hypothetical protein